MLSIDSSQNLPKTPEWAEDLKAILGFVPVQGNGEGDNELEESGPIENTTQRVQSAREWFQSFDKTDESPKSKEKQDYSYVYRYYLIVFLDCPSLG